MTKSKKFGTFAVVGIVDLIALLAGALEQVPSEYIPDFIMWFSIIALGVILSQAAIDFQLARNGQYVPPHERGTESVVTPPNVATPPPVATAPPVATFTAPPPSYTHATNEAADPIMTAWGGGHG